MGFLKRLFSGKPDATGSGAAEGIPTPARNAGEVTPEAAETTRKYIKRAPRVRLHETHRVRFEGRGEALPGPLPLINLSVEGIGFANFGRKWPATPHAFEGSLIIRDKVYPVRAELLYVAPSVAGARLLEKPPELREEFLKYFFGEMAAARMKQVNSAVLQQDADGTPHFFVGENNCEVYYVENAGRLVHFHVSFFGNYFAMEKGGALKVGIVEEDTAEDKPGYKGATLVKPSQLSPEIILAAEQFLMNVEKLDPAARQGMMAVLRGE